MLSSVETSKEVLYNNHEIHSRKNNAFVLCSRSQTKVMNVVECLNRNKNIVFWRSLNELQNSSSLANKFCSSRGLSTSNSSVLHFCIMFALFAQSMQICLQHNSGNLEYLFKKSSYYVNFLGMIFIHRLKFKTCKMLTVYCICDEIIKDFRGPVFLGHPVQFSYI